MTLDSLACGSRAIIRTIDWAVLAPEEGTRLRALGIDLGAQIGVAHKGVFGGSDPIAVTIGRMTIAIRRAHAAAMHIEPV
ncbi:MAG: FeoA family protein [Pontixanthobacter sp.]